MYFLLFGLIVLVPVDASSSNADLRYGDGKRATGLSIFSLANIDADKEAIRLIPHLLSVLLNSIVVYYMFYKLYKTFVKYKLRGQQEMRTGNFTVLIRNVHKDTTDGEIYELFDRLFPNKVLSIHRTICSKSLYKFNEKRNKFIRELEYSYYEAKRSGEVPLIRKGEADSIKKKIFPCFREEVSSIDYYKGKIEKYTSLIEDKSKTTNYSDFIFVTFKDRLTRSECSNMQIVKDGKVWQSNITNDPRDVIWSNFRISTLNRNIRYIIIFFVTIIIGLVFTLPIIFAQGLANLQSLSNIPVFNFLVSLIEYSPFLTDLVSGLLPPLVVTLFFAIVEIIVEFLVWLESPLTKGRALQRFFTKFHFFQIFNVFIITLFAGSFMSRIDIFIECALTTPPQALIELVGRAISGQVNYFINYFAMAIVTLSILSLQPFPLIKYFVKNYLCCCVRSCRSRTPRDFSEEKNMVRFKLGLKSSQSILNFIIVLTFSSISAVIVPFAIFELSVNFFTSRYVILYLHQKDSEGHGVLWPKCFSLLFIGVTIYQVIMAGVFLVKSFVVGVVIAILLAICTVIYTIMMNRTMYRLIKKGTIIGEGDSTINEEVMTKKLRDSFKDPNLTPKFDHFFRESMKLYGPLDFENEQDEIEEESEKNTSNETEENLGSSEIESEQE